MTTRLRVIQWTTGDVGRRALRAILARPDLELVGVYAHGANELGRDAAEQCGLEQPTGVRATRSLSLRPALRTWARASRGVKRRPRARRGRRSR